jgi:flagellar FliL protein
MADDDESDEEVEDEDDEDLDEEDSDKSNKKGISKKVIIIIAAVLLLVIGGLAAAYFTGLLNPVIAMVSGSADQGNVEEDGEKNLMEVVFFPLEEIIVNLGTGGRNSSFLKLRVNLELESSDDIPKIEIVLPRIMDKFQVYLRELRLEDIKGSSGMYRMREELLSRVNNAAAPTKVNDVLFKEMLIQ